MYSSPEVLRGGAHTLMSDIWALGCTLLEVSIRSQAAMPLMLMELGSDHNFSASVWWKVQPFTSRQGVRQGCTPCRYHSDKLA